MVQVAPARAILAFDVKRRATVDCLEGEIWVTGPGIGDQVLSCGESTLVQEPGRIVVEALVASRVRVLRETTA